ncbi:MAG: DUF4221 family protein [Roseivirga sp.]|uniref:DUF4221 family protein n=1 Tax=Roseivirga sp. TaxID=1964215 RepID=UPI001B2E0034|nr:DUF4221 family protein [Roseivirga sp.]MBO6661745.1 DUF4221 family protein [Roseivirga sp.]MBO6908270.1 DUF4221 family protein [Roseivirga sp.]
MNFEHCKYRMMGLAQIAHQYKISTERNVLKSRLPVVLLFFTLWSCSNLQKDNEDPRTISLVIDESELIFDHKDYFISNYSIFFKSVGEDSLILFEGQNSREFFLFDTKNTSVSKLMEFESSGPNFLDEEVIDLETYANGYAILSSDYLQFTDIDGIVNNRIRINNYKNNFSNPSAFKATSIKFISEDSLLIAKKIISSDIPDVVDRPKQPIFGFFNLKSDSISDLEIFSPKETLVQDIERGYYSNLSEHYFLIQNDQIIFNYKFSPSIYKVNINSLDVSHFSGASDNFPVKREPFLGKNYTDYVSLIEHLNHGVYFSEIVFDVRNQLYFRLAKSVEKKENGSLNLSNYLQVFDQEFNLLKEIKLNEMMKLIHGYSNGSIYLVPLSKYQTSENATRIIKYSFSKKEE